VLVSNVAAKENRKSLDGRWDKCSRYLFMSRKWG